MIYDIIDAKSGKPAENIDNLLFGQNSIIFLIKNNKEIVFIQLNVLHTYYKNVQCDMECKKI